MMEEFGAGFWIGLILGFAAIVLSLGWIVAGVTNRDWQFDTIERGLALHCPDNGAWAWKGECDA